MPAPSTLSATVWIVWAIIGITGGYMTGRLLPEGAPTWATLISGIAASCLGGWLYTRFTGTAEDDIYISFVASAALTALVLWTVTRIAGRRNREE